MPHEGMTLAKLGPGEFFGEEAILGSGRRNSDVIALTPTTGFAMFGAYFCEFEMEFPELAARIDETIRRRHAADSSIGTMNPR